MTDGSQLLRLLEPVYRPDGQAGPVTVRDDEALPIESRSFASLLAEAKAQSAGEGASIEAGDEAAGVLDASLLRPLSQVDRIENATLRAMFTDE